MDDEHYSIGRSYSRVYSVTFGSWWVLPGAFCACLTFFIVEGNVSIARFLGMRGGLIETLLFDLTVLILMPMFAVMWWHIRGIDKSRLELKRQFLDAHRAERLVVYKYDAQRVYKVINSKVRGGEIEVVPMWTADGPVARAESCLSEAEAFSEFDPAAFLGR